MEFIFKIARKIRKYILSLPRRINIYDNYIDYLFSANPGLVHEGNLYCFKYVADNLVSDKPIVEIGALCGLSTNVISYYLQNANKDNKIYSCDLWEYNICKKSKCINLPVSNEQYSNFIKENYIRNTNMFSKKNAVCGIKLKSDIFFKKWINSEKVIDINKCSVQLGGKISFCYIDGDHSYKQAKKDFVNADKIIEIGGFVLFDDSAPYSGVGCAKLMPEILKNNRYKLIIANPNYLFQKIGD